ncbi:MAG: hypothetical protein KBD37_01660, partial [Burkholderiales bacterium]|nr:hypothetical protein [Burkholderiales bacterium]
PLTYTYNELIMMSKFPWSGCSTLLGECFNPSLPSWHSGKYLLSWYLMQIPTLYLFLFIIGIYASIKVGYQDKSIRCYIIVIFLQLSLLPLLIVLHNSTLYDGNRHTLFCLPAIVIIMGLGLQFICTAIFKQTHNYVRISIISIMLLFMLILIIDNLRMAPYQYAYFNEIGRQLIKDNNTETDYWAFSLREAYQSIDMIKYDTPYLTGEPLDVLAQYAREDSKLIKYDKNFPFSVNVVATVRDNTIDNIIDAANCQLAAIVSRKLLFMDGQLVMSKAYNCNSTHRL